MAFRVEVAVQSDIGLVRRSNQDSFGRDDSLSLYLICDGMGGAAGGEVASSLAVETFLAVARQEIASLNGSVDATKLALQRAVAAANRAVVARANWDIGLRGMGTTLVAARLWGDRLTVVNVGDSRAYLLRQGSAKQITEDHSYVAERVRMGLMPASQAAVSGLQSVITRAIGADADVLADLFELEVRPGDALLLTSDGLTRHATAAEIAEIVSGHAPQEACRLLAELAKDRGGSDNITCLIARVLDQA